MTQVLSPVADSLDQTKLRFIEADGIRTRYYEDGEGEPLVLLHGGHFGSLYSLDAFSTVLPALAQRFHVYALDKLGQGYTNNPEHDEEYTFERLLRHTAAVLDALGIAGAHLAGHSRGALLAARLALDVPGLARSVLALSTNTLAPDDPRYPGGEFYADVARRTPPGTPTLDSVRMEPDAQAFSTAQVTADFVVRLLAISGLPKTLDAQERMKRLTDSVWAPSLARVKAETLTMIDDRGLPVRTLVLWGMNDKSAQVPLAFTLYGQIAAKTPDAELHISNGSGHYTFREQPEAFVRTVEAFCLR